MNKLLLTTAIAGLLSAGVTPALADNTDIDQVLHDMQIALNSISINFDSTGGSQSAINAGNLIDLEEELDDVFQKTWADQVASNYAFTMYGSWDDFDQTATNVANSLTLPADEWYGDAEDVTQIASGLADQFAQNMTIYETLASKVTQEATNALNLINLDDVDETVVQNVNPGNFQTAMNFLVGGGGFSQVNKAKQSATNVANVIEANELDVVYQNAGNIQLAANLVDFGSGGWSMDHDLNKTRQTATNAVNVVTVDDLNEKIDQDSWGDQTALNTAVYVGAGTGWFGWQTPFDGTVVDLKQTATNVANVITVSGNLPDISGTTEISQFSDTTQFASNVLSGMGNLSDVVQSATNVANSIGVPSGS